MALKIRVLEQGRVAVKGDLTFASIDRKAVMLLDFKQFGANSVVNINLHEVNLSDSAGLALMIEWIKLSQDYEVELHFSHIPSQLLALAQLSGFENNDYFLN